VTYTPFFSDKFAMYLGLIDTFDGDQNEFATGRGNSQFMNYNFVFAAPTAFVPGSMLGVGLLALANENLHITSTVFSAKNATNSNAIDDIHHNGGISATEIRTQFQLGDLPGGINGMFVYFFDKDFTELDGKVSTTNGELDPETQDDSWLTVLSGWQYLYTEEDPGKGPLNLANGHPDLQGVGLFGRVAFADEDTNPWKFSASGGIGGRGVIPSRDHDVLGLGYYYADFETDRFLISDNLDSSQQGVEVFYNIALTPAARLTLDFQWLDNPFSDLDDSYVVGARLVTSF
jgi:porin